MCLQVVLDLKEWVLIEQQIRRPIGDDLQETHRIELGTQVCQKIDGRSVGPVQIIKEENQWPETRNVLEKGSQFPFHAFLRCRFHVCQEPRGGGIVR